MAGQKPGLRFQLLPLRLLAPLAISLIFIFGYFVGYLNNFGFHVSRIVYGDTQESLLEQANNDLSWLIVDINAPEVTPPSTVKIVNRPIHAPSSCAAFEETHKSPSTQFVYFVFSTAEQKRTDRRRAMRETWASLLTPNCGFRVIYVLGQLNKHAATEVEVDKLQAQVDKEAAQFGDILQFGQFIDSGKTPTLKAQLAFEWSLQECPNAKYTGKLEDHLWMNVNEWHKFVLAYPPDFVFGHRVGAGTPVFRDPQSYFYVSRAEFMDDTYPEYICGMLYVIPQKVLKTLLEKAKDVPKIPVEEVYWTGMVPNAAGIPRKNSDRFEYDYIIDAARKGKCPKEQFIAVRYMPPSEQYLYWRNNCANNALTVCPATIGSPQPTPAPPAPPAVAAANI